MTSHVLVTSGVFQLVHRCTRMAKDSLGEYVMGVEGVKTWKYSWNNFPIEYWGIQLGNLVVWTVGQRLDLDVPEYLRPRLEYIEKFPEYIYPYFFTSGTA